MKGKAKAARLEVVHPDCAGIDVGKRKHYVAVDPSRFESPVRHFGSFTGDLKQMADWLASCGVKQVAMESTGVYWIPVFEVLDRAGFEVHLVNPRGTKQVSGRKSDVLDCQWIRQLMSYGLLRGAFRAPDALCPLRSYARQRSRLIRGRSRAVQQMQKALTQMNVQLDNALSDVMGKTGQKIVRAIVAGERDGWVLAKHRDGRCKADEATLAASLEGNWRDEHLFALEQALARYDMLREQIEACERCIDAELDALPGDGTDEPPGGGRRRRGAGPAPRPALASAAAGGLGGGLDRHSDHWGGDGPYGGGGVGRGSVALSFGGALLLVAGPGAGNPHQRRQATGRTVGAPNQPGRPSPADGGLHGAQQQNGPWRGASPAVEPNGRRQGGQGHRASTGAADLRHADAGGGIRRARLGPLGGRTPRAADPQPYAAGAAL